MNLTATLGMEGCRYIESAGRAWSFPGVQFRSSARDSSELYFATKLNGSYSESKDSVRFHSGATLGRVTQAEWAAARAMPRGDVRVAGEGEIGATDDHDLIVAGKRFARSGEHFAMATGSASGQRIAVYSYDGQQQTPIAGNISVPGRSKHPTKGKAYVDVFDPISGRKVLALAGPFRGDIPTNWFLRSFFIGDRYLFFPIATSGDVVQTFWVCEVNSNGVSSPHLDQR